MNNNSVHIQMNFSLYQAHGTVMILAWMVFGSTGIIFARYGRSLRLGNRRQFLGKAFWFQIHRFLLTFTPLLTLLGLFLVLVKAGGNWVNPRKVDRRLLLHSVFGSIIVCCSVLQVWLALYRCHPRSQFRFFFDWSHRITGLLAFTLAIPNYFLISFVLPMNNTILLIIVSIWAGWIVIIILIFEKIEYQQRATVAPRNGRGDEPTQDNTNAPVDIESGTNPNIGNRYLTIIKLIIIFLHIPISITLAILLIIFIYI
jgi:hypothetical protein